MKTQKNTQKSFQIISSYVKWYEDGTFMRYSKDEDGMIIAEPIDVETYYKEIGY